MTKNLTTISISKKTHEILTNMGKKGEPFEDILTKLIEKAEEPIIRPDPVDMVEPMKTSTKPQNKNISCLVCEVILRDVCRLLTLDESMWFRKCASEIEEHDGHDMLERFLRLYRYGLFTSKYESKKLRKGGFPVI